MDSSTRDVYRVTKTRISLVQRELFVQPIYGAFNMDLYTVFVWFTLLIKQYLLHVHVDKYIIRIIIIQGINFTPNERIYFVLNYIF